MSKSDTLRVLRWNAINRRAWGNRVEPVGKLTRKLINWLRNSSKAPTLKLVGSEYKSSGARYESGKPDPEIEPE